VFVLVAGCSGSVDSWLSVSADTRVGPAAGSGEGRDADGPVVRAEGGGVELGRRFVEAISLPGDGGLAVDEGLHPDVGAAKAVTLVNARGGSSNGFILSVHTFHAGSTRFISSGKLNQGR